MNRETMRCSCDTTVSASPGIACSVFGDRAKDADGRTDDWANGRGTRTWTDDYYRLVAWRAAVDVTSRARSSSRSYPFLHRQPCARVLDATAADGLATPADLVRGRRTGVRVVAWLDGAGRGQRSAAAGVYTRVDFPLWKQRRRQRAYNIPSLERRRGRRPLRRALLRRFTYDHRRPASSTSSATPFTRARNFHRRHPSATADGISRGFTHNRTTETVRGAVEDNATSLLPLPNRKIITIIWLVNIIIYCARVMCCSVLAVLPVFTSIY